jgi:hypothetical protein
VSGYLTLDAHGKMIIPNHEIHYYFEQMIQSWFGGTQNDQFIARFLEDLIEGNTDDIQLKLSQLILETMSFHDVTANRQESFYHGLLLGITLGLRGRYVVKSNHESGYGRYDLGLYPTDPHRDPGIVIEVKFEKKAKAGLKQINDKAYHQELLTHGCSKIRSYSFAFDGKKVTSRASQS